MVEEVVDVSGSLGQRRAGIQLSHESFRKAWTIKMRGDICVMRI